MKRFVILEADNVGTDIYMSKIYRSKDAAKKELKNSYHRIVDEPDCDIETMSCDDEKYKVLLVNGDFLYGRIKEIDTNCKPDIEVPELKLCSIQELAKYYADLILNDGKFNENIPGCDFAIADSLVPEGASLEDIRDSSSGWYGMKKFDAGFDSTDLCLIADYYGGGCAEITQLFEGMDDDDIADEIERIILGTFNVCESAHRDTELIVEFHTEKGDENDAESV